MERETDLLPCSYSDISLLIVLWAMPQAKRYKMRTEDKNIPIIEAVPGKGYWRIEKNEEGKITSKTWHSEDNWNKMKFQDYDKSAKKYNMGGDWMNLDQGDNKIKIVSEFEDYGAHYDQKSNKSITCIGKDEGCPYCEKGDKPKVQYLGWVIDRKDNEVKLLRIGHSVFKQIGALAESDEYGFETIPLYDITIKRKGEGLDTEYSVIPGRTDTDLTEEEKKKVSEKVTPPEEIIEGMKTKATKEIYEGMTGKPGKKGTSGKGEDDNISPEDIPF